METLKLKIRENALSDVSFQPRKLFLGIQEINELSWNTDFIAENFGCTLNMLNADDRLDFYEAANGGHLMADTSFGVLPITLVDTPSMVEFS